MRYEKNHLTARIRKNPAAFDHQRPNDPGHHGDHHLHTTKLTPPVTYGENVYENLYFGNII